MTDHRDQLRSKLIKVHVISDLEPSWVPPTWPMIRAGISDGAKDARGHRDHAELDLTSSTGLRPRSRKIQ